MVQGRFTYQVSSAIRETGAVGATISDVTATLAETSGATTENRLSAIEAFGTTRIPANGTLASTGITVTGLLQTAAEITVRVAFLDDHGNAESVLTSTGVKLDLTGEWTESTGRGWPAHRVSLVQSGDSLTGELVSPDGFRLPLNGSVARDGVPGVSGSAGGSTGCAVGLTMTEFEFRSGRLECASGRVGGRCPGTVGGSFELQRGG